MKIRKLNQQGFSHYLLPAIVVLAVALIGVKVLNASHADSPTTVTLAAAADSSQPQNLAILGPANVAPGGIQGTQSSVPFEFVGSQIVDHLLSGASLTYNDGIKGDVTACYEVFVTQPKVNTVTATVEFANNNNYITRNISSTTTDDLQQVCVKPGHKTNPGFNVKNLTSTQQNTTVEVYRDVLTW